MCVERARTRPPLPPSRFTSTPPGVRQDENAAKWVNLSGCAVGTVAGSMVALPIVLYHAGSIPVAALGYWIASTGVLALVAISFFTCRPIKSRY